MSNNEMKIVKEFNIPIQGEKECKESNEKYGTNYKTTEEHVSDMIDQIYEIISNLGDNNWYVGDSLKIQITAEYCPEDK